MAEKTFFAQSQPEGGYSMIGLEEILQCTEPEYCRKLIQEVIPARFAARITDIECMTPAWHTVPALTQVHEIVTESFEKIRLLDRKVGNEEFGDVIAGIRHRHEPIGLLLSQAAKEVKICSLVDEARMDQLIGKYMTSRIGTEMLCHHYISLLTDPDVNHIGIVDTKCNPAAICQHAIDFVRDRIAPLEINIRLYVAQPDIELSFIPTYLRNIVKELLWNAVNATVAWQRYGGSTWSDIGVTVCADPAHVGIQISDKAGGVPSEHAESIWKWTFTTNRDSYICSRSGNEQSGCFLDDTPLSVPGMGLPLCRVYAQYLGGGELHLMSMPGIGTDVYLFINRVEAHKHMGRPHG